MILAYCPALDFNPKEIYVTFDQILEIVNAVADDILKSGKTRFQIAADLHAKSDVPQIHKPIVKARKARGPNKPKPLLLTNGNENQDVN